MAQNPLQKFFRQPKVFISLPSGGIYNSPGIIDGDPANLAVYGMTGMDEILMKTPDALLSGDSTATVIASCCPAIKDPWNIASIDIDLILTAIRVATHGNEIVMGTTCEKCGTENEYTLDLNKLIDFYSNCTFDNSVVVDQFKIAIRPLTYKESTDYALVNYELQQKLRQVPTLTSTEEQKEATNGIFKSLAKLKNDIFATSIESVDTGDVVVTERAYIREWLENCDSEIIDKISEHIQHNQTRWTGPKHETVCSHCGHESSMVVTMDQATFFVNA